MTSIEAVIFDLDGTLLDHNGAVRAALRLWLPTMGAAASAGLLRAWLDAEERHLPAWRSREISFAEQRRRRLRDFLPLIDASFDEADLDQVFAGYLEHYEASWTAFDDAAPTLDALAQIGVPIAVLTNGTIEQQTAKMAAVGLIGQVGPIVTAGELGSAKPDPATYLAVCGRLGVSPSATVHVGDRYELDVVAPRAAGLRAVHLDRIGAGPFDEPHRIESLSELLSLVRNPTWA